jgi:hypothetical protein
MSRVCGCGCGQDLAGRRANARFFDVACRVRAHREKKRVVLLPSRGSSDVTVSAAPTTLRRAA